jgi:YD repeat-containing protein
MVAATKLLAGLDARFSDPENFAMDSSSRPEGPNPLDNPPRREAGHPRVTTYTYDASGRMLAMSAPDPRSVEGRQPFHLVQAGEAGWLRPGEENPPPRIEHDREKKLYRITDQDGKTEVFRDEPVRFLVVEPNRETGELRLVTYGGMPHYLYLCREEREPRR